MILILLQQRDEKSPIYQKILKMIKIYQKVPVLSGFDKKVKKFLRIDSPQDHDYLKKPKTKENKTKHIKNKIKYFIEMTTQKRSSFLSVVQKMMNRMRKSVNIWNDGENHLKTIESNLDRKISEIKKKIKNSNKSNYREIEINRKRLDVLEGMKQKQEMETSFRDLLDKTLIGNIFNTGINI